MSKLSEDTHILLKEVFPHHTILLEHYVRYKGAKLFFDFYIKELSVFIEVQGRQHDEYVAHFHGDREGYLSSKRRDNLKKEYCEVNDIVLVEVRKKLNRKSLLRSIWKEMTR